MLYAVPGVINSTVYNARGQIASRVYANGVATTYSYNAARGWLSSVTHANVGGTLMGLTYARDAAGRITGVASATDAKESWTYTQDGLDRLTAATDLGDATLSQTFQYDLAGNITFNSKLGAYTYPAATAPHPHAPLTAGSRAFTAACPRASLQARPGGCQRQHAEGWPADVPIRW